VRSTGPLFNCSNPNRRHRGSAAIEQESVESSKESKSNRDRSPAVYCSTHSFQFPGTGPSEDILALDEALTRLADHDPIKAAVVRLRFFAGLTGPEVAKALEFSLATVERHWTYARTWLYAELGDQDQE
jgi:DNA-directed RNA polymerase specialized sigma24 family protein